MNYYENPALSQSKLKDLDDSVRKFYNKHILNQPQAKPDAFRFGNAFDEYMTNNINFINNWKIKQTETTRLDYCITEKEFKNIQEMANNVNNFSVWEDESIFQNHNLQNLFKLCEKQKEIYWHDDQLAIDYKAKLDYLFKFENCYTVFDLKTTCCDNLNDFMDSITKFKYYLQVAMYSSAVKTKYKLDYYPDFYFIGVSKKTFQCWVLKASFNMLITGLQEIKRLTILYQSLTEKNNWLKDEQCCEVNISCWKQKQIDNNLIGQIK